MEIPRRLFKGEVGPNRNLDLRRFPGAQILLPVPGSFQGHVKGPGLCVKGRA